jgi:hypothetical protein
MIENVRIKSTHLGPEDHGIFSAMLLVEGANGGGGFGGHDLRLNGALYIQQLLTALKVRRWEDLSGLVVRVWTHRNTYVAIGHVIDDSWFRNDGIGDPRVTTEKELRGIFNVD